MRATFYPPTALQLGYGAFPVYKGIEYQRGAGVGNLFRNLWKFIFPIAKSVAKGVGQEALRSAAAIATDVADGVNVKQAAKRHVTEGAKRAIRKGTKKVETALQEGKGLGKAKSTRALTKAKSINMKVNKPKARKKRQVKKKDILGYYYTT